MQYSVAPAHACARLTAQAAIPFPMQICAIRRAWCTVGRAAAVAEERSGVSQWLRALTWRAAGGGGGKRDGRARGSGKNFEADIELQLTAIQPSACLTRPRSRHRIFRAIFFHLPHGCRPLQLWPDATREALPSRGCMTWRIFTSRVVVKQGVAEVRVHAAGSTAANHDDLPGNS